MKKIISIIFIFVSLLLVGPDRFEQIYVKDIYMDKTEGGYQIQIISYDFSSQEEAFISNVYRSDNIFSLAADVMKDANYNLRLCENCIISKNMTENINRVVYVINSMKIPPSADLVCISGEYDYNTFEDMGDNNSPVYNLKVTNGKVTGYVSVCDSTGKHTGTLVYHQGIVAKFTDKKQSDIMFALINRIKTMDYTFRQGQICAEIDVLDCFYTKEKNSITINFNCILNRVTGINNYTQDKTVYTDILENELKNDIFHIVTDPVINSVYKTYECLQGEEIIININII